jgi:hypothetical protein
MANVTEKVASIRQAVYGKDVRESIASGIEAINDEVVSTTSRQNVIDSQEQTRINNENIRQSQEASRQSQESVRTNIFNTNEDAREATFNTNENNRQDIFSTNEVDRDATIAQFQNWYNTSSLTGKLPFMIDGGDFGDPIEGGVYDGGDF